MRDRVKIISLVLSSLLVSGLQANVITLEDIVITAKSDNALMDTPASISVITADEISSMGVASLKDILNNISGISLGLNGSSVSGRQNISIRGSRAEDVLILVDGKTLSGSDAQISHSDFQYNWVPINSIEKIEVIKGPMSAIYGSQAIGGVINIITKKTDKKFSGNLEIEKGFSAEENGGDTQNIALNLGGKVGEKLSVDVSVQKQTRDAAYRDNRVDDPTTLFTDESKVTKIEGKDLLSGMLKIEYEIDGTQNIYGSLIRGDEKRYLYKTQEELYYDIKKYVESIGYFKDFSYATLDFEYSSIESDNGYHDFGQSPYYTHYLKNQTLKANATIDMFDNNFIAMGAEYKEDSYDKIYSSTANQSKNFSGKINNKALYVQDEIEIGNKWTIALGARYDYHEKFGSHTTSNINAIYRLNSQDRIKASYAEGFKAPTLTQNSSTYILTMGSTFRGNDDLDPETSKTLNLSYEHYEDDLVFKSSIFQTKLKDLVTSQKQTTGAYVGDYLYVNIKEATMRGVELELSKIFFNDLQLDLGYNYLETEDAMGAELDFRPKSKITTRINKTLPFGIRSTLSAIYTGPQKNGTTDIDGYTVLSTQFTKEVIKELNVKVGATNLTNQDLKDNPYEIPARVIYVGLNYSF
ncbi:MAG: TonB-dependent receptor [Campylobacterales bacterium]|nr:TonB-dependent receptor [Campylobacterales bacterium]